MEKNGGRIAQRPRGTFGVRWMILVETVGCFNALTLQQFNEREARI